MRALALVFACCVGCNTGLPYGALSPDAGDGNGGNGDGDAMSDLDLGGQNDMRGDLSHPGDLGAPPLHLIVQAEPTTIGSAKTFTVSFQVLDAADAPVNISRPVFIALGMQPAGAILTGPTTVVAHDSVATFNLSLDHWGAYTLIATTSDAPPLETPILHVQGTRLGWVTQPTNAVAHVPFAPAVRVGIVDVTGAVDTTATGTVSLTTQLSSCAGSFYGTSYATATAGIATFADIYFDKACTGYHLQATGSYPLDSPAITSDPFDIVAGAPAQLALETQLTHELASRDMPFNLLAHVEDAGGNEVPAATTVTLSVSPAVALGGPTSAMTSGTTATFTGVTVGVAGNLTFEASAPGLTPGYTTLSVTPWQWRNTNTAPLVVDPTNPSTVWIDGAAYGYDDKLARSTDAAATFTPVGDLPNNATTLTIDPLAPATMYGSDGYETWKSTDGGQTTSNLTLTGGPYALTVDPSSSSRLYAVSGTNVWKSVDGGATWSPITPAIASNMTTLTVDPTNAAVLYLSGSNVWRSTDGGATWSAAIGLQAPSYDGLSRVAIDPAQPSRVVVCDGTGCYRSVDSGANFAQVYTGYLGYNPVTVAFDPAAPNTLYACGAYGLATSTNGGDSFTDVPLQLYPSTVFSCTLAPSSPSTIYMVTSDGTWISTNGGK